MNIDEHQVAPSEVSKKNWTSLIFLFSRLFLGGVFVYASYDKILHPAAFAEVVYNYQILPEILINSVAVILPWLEVLIGSLLIFGVWMPGTALWSAVLLLSFFGALLFNMARGLDIDCGCFRSSDISEQGAPMAWYIIRDFVLLVVAIYLSCDVVSRTRRIEARKSK